jgi:hypothetical protein
LPDAASLNVPYDATHEELLLAFLAGLSGFALIRAPRSKFREANVASTGSSASSVAAGTRSMTFPVSNSIRHRQQRPGSICRSSSVLPWR